MSIEERKKRRMIKGLHYFHDLVFTIAAFIFAYFIKKDILPSPWGGLALSPNYYIVLLLIVIIWFMVLKLFNPYSFFALKDLKKILKDTIKITTISFIGLVACLYFFNIKNVSRIMLGIFYILDLSFLLIGKRTIYHIFQNRFQREQNLYNVLVIGSKKRAAGAIGLLKSSHTGYNIIGCLDTDATRVGKEVRSGVTVIGTMDEIDDIILNRVVDEVIFAMPLIEIESVSIYMLLIEVIGIKVRIIPDWQIYALYKPQIASIYFDEFNGLPSMVISAISHKARDLLVKSSMDFLAAIFFSIVLLPVFILISLIIKLTSRGPIFFKQERVGLNGRTFALYKFRTMVCDAEEKLQELEDMNESDGPTFKIKKDPRIIPYIGTCLRKTSLDELPQLINVLKSEMSLVGPRPPLMSEVKQYDVWQRRRLSMKPGLTCLWQIAPNRNDISFDRWMELDLKYIDNWSLSLDVSILWKTFMTVILGRGR